MNNFISKKLKKLNSLFLIISGISILQAGAIFEERFCSENSVLNATKNCSLVSYFKITFPGNFLLDNYYALREIQINKSSSGMVVSRLPEVRNRFKDLKNGFNFYYPKGTRKDAGYILKSLGDPSKDGEPGFELWDLNEQKLIYKWDINTKDIQTNAQLKLEKKLNGYLNPNSVIFRNPLLLENGDLIFLINDKNVAKLSLNGEITNFSNEYSFHHSIEIDDQGYLYIPFLEKNKDNKPFKEDGFVILNKQFDIEKKYFLSKIFENSGFNYLIYSNAITEDPFHLNDVVPIPDEKKTRTVLLSLRNLSAIIAVDLESEKIIWMLHGYGNQQHDVDILDKDGSSISIFDNNIIKDTDSAGNIFTIIEKLPLLKNTNNQETIIFSAPSKNEKEKNLSIRKVKFNSLPEKFRPKTITSGQSEYVINNDSIYMEESNYGHSFEYNLKTEELMWQYVNRNNSNDLYYRISWSRRLKSLPESLIKILQTNSN